MAVSFEELEGARAKARKNLPDRGALERYQGGLTSLSDTLLSHKVRGAQGYKEEIDIFLDVLNDIHDLAFSSDNLLRQAALQSASGNMDPQVFSIVQGSQVLADVDMPTLLVNVLKHTDTLTKTPEGVVKTVQGIANGNSLHMYPVLPALGAFHKHAQTMNLQQGPSPQATALRKAARISKGNAARLVPSATTMEKYFGILDGIDKGLQALKLGGNASKLLEGSKAIRHTLKGMNELRDEDENVLMTTIGKYIDGNDGSGRNVDHFYATELTAYRILSLREGRECLNHLIAAMNGVNKPEKLADVVNSVKNNNNTHVWHPLAKAMLALILILGHRIPQDRTFVSSMASGNKYDISGILTRMAGEVL